MSLSRHSPKAEHFELSHDKQRLSKSSTNTPVTEIWHICSDVLLSIIFDIVEIVSMDSEELLMPFKHDELPDAATHISLLRISRCVGDKRVACELSTWTVEDVPDYVAVSYTWGDPASTSEITLNGRPMEVRQNCDEVLRQAFGFAATRYFWVDAICIDQSSNQEKNHQVAMMGQIFARATEVIAGVGPQSDDHAGLHSATSSDVSTSCLKSSQMIQIVNSFTMKLRYTTTNVLHLHQNVFYGLSRGRR